MLVPHKKLIKSMTVSRSLEKGEVLDTTAYLFAQHILVTSISHGVSYER